MRAIDVTDRFMYKIPELITRLDDFIVAKRSIRRFLH